MKFLHALIAAGAAAFTLTAAAQVYPAKTVKIVAPVQPGGGVDLVARTMAERYAKALGQSFAKERNIQLED